ncbi:uncharacterized protein METZ01_LOCUS19670 [marine metagenome]|uniref:Uncharacterized protein n=1 Tax=marine metagenome TaxID=408172 RepID=A0A381PII5_9ZZZZ
MCAEVRSQSPFGFRYRISLHRHTDTGQGQACLRFRCPVLVQAVQDYDGNFFAQDEICVVGAVRRTKHVNQNPGGLRVTDMEFSRVRLAGGDVFPPPVVRRGVVHARLNLDRCGDVLG